MQEVLVNHLGGLSLPRKSVVRLTDRPDMTLDVYHERKTTMQTYASYLIKLWQYVDQLIDMSVRTATSPCEDNRSRKVFNLKTF